MTDRDENVEVKFRLYDGSDIGPSKYAPSITIGSLKDKIIAEWPPDKKVVPKTTNDLKLIYAGKILENNKTLGDSRVPFGELPGGVITMHVVVPPAPRAMEKFHKSQCAKILLIALLLLVTPLLSSSIRPLYLYLLFNLLVIALGAESGVLSAISRPPMTSTTTASAKQPLINITNSYKEPMTAPSPGADTQEEETVRSVVTASEVTECNGAAVSTAKAAVQRSASEKAKQAPKMAVKIGEVVKKCPSMPSLFFIGGCDGDEEGAEEEEEEEEMGVPTKQELFAKAETFIGNFYKQLKIQREDSWKRIQNSLYHRRAF